MLDKLLKIGIIIGMEEILDDSYFFKEDLCVT